MGHPPDKRRRRGTRTRRASSAAADLAATRSRLRSRTTGKRRGRRGRLSFGRRLWRTTRRVLDAVWALPVPLRVLAGAVLLLVAWAGVNVGYQVLRKPTELFFPVSSGLAKSPPETWRMYGSLFAAHATAAIPPELLAALAQVESSGNPVARTYWRWRPAPNPLEWYRPASSAVGMYQITDATFQGAKRYCIHDHVVAEDGPWHDFDSCWFNSLYTRVLPTHAVELTAAWLDRSIARTLAGARLGAATREQRQDLAAVIHLCGAGAGAAYAARGFRLAPDQQCGAHDVGGYLGKVRALTRQFARLAAGG